MSCPYTSQQNGKAERILRTTNNVIRTLLFQASMPPCYWADALATATLLLNRLPTKTLHMSTPHFALYGTLRSYHELRVFGCTCYPNLTATASHKLAPRSTLCAFLGLSSDHKGYRCLDLTTNRVIIPRHVVFDESSFPFSHQCPSPSSDELDFLTNNEPLSAPSFPAGTPTHQHLTPCTGSVTPVRSPPGFQALQAPLVPQEDFQIAPLEMPLAPRARPRMPHVLPRVPQVPLVSVPQAPQVMVPQVLVPQAPHVQEPAIHPAPAPLVPQALAPSF